MELEVTSKTKGGNKLCSLQTLGNLFFLELGLQSNSRCLVTLFSKVTSTSGIDNKDMQVWKLSESLDSMESLMTATSALNENSSTPSSQERHPTLNNF
jgi:hypothetical protein